MVFRPFIKVEGLTSKEFRQAKISIPDFTAVIFTARTAIDHYFRLCEEMRINIPDTMKYFCTSEAIALYLQKYIIYRKRKIFFGTSGKLDDPDLLKALNKHIKEKFPSVRKYNPKTPIVIEKIINKACAKSPIDRYRSAIDMRKDIERILQNPDLIKKKQGFFARLFKKK